MGGIGGNCGNGEEKLCTARHFFHTSLVQHLWVKTHTNTEWNCADVDPDKDGDCCDEINGVKEFVIPILVWSWILGPVMSHFGTITVVPNLDICVLGVVRKFGEGLWLLGGGMGWGESWVGKRCHS